MADLVIERCLPSDRAASIHELFARAGQPEFAGIFQQVYRPRERHGLRSWVASDADRVLLHISLALQPFSDGTRTVSVGLLGDLMADASHRDFWGPIKVVRRMVADVKQERTADVLLTSYLPAATAVFKAGGLTPVAAMHRYVMPLVWPYPLVRRWLHGEGLPALTAVPFAEARMADFLADMTSPGSFRPVATPEFFETRMPRKSYPSGTWLLMGAVHAPDVAVLVSPTEGELVVADVVWRHGSPPLAGALSATARWASGQGHRRLSLTVMQSTPLATAAKRAGFLIRPGAYPLMMRSLAARDDAVPVEEWTFTPFVLTSW
jgi:hypothetical protein